MPSLSLVTQAGAPDSSATATLVQSFNAIGAGTSDSTSILQTQALPKLYFWVDCTVGGPLTLTPQFAIRGNTDITNLVQPFQPDPDWKDLGPPVIHAGAGTGPQLYIYEFPAVWIRLQYTTGGAGASTFECILAASV